MIENIGCKQAGTLTGGIYAKMFEESRRVYSPEGISPTVHTAGGGGQQLKILDSDLPNVRIRMLTEKECFRLMGVKDEDYAKIAPNQSKTSRVHLAGDSIVTTCLMAIFGEMFENVDYRQKIQEVVESVKEGKNERD